MNDRTRLSIYELQMELAQKQNYRCAVCGKRLSTGTLQLGHRIPQSEIGRYGGSIIHHWRNVAAVCSLECNKKVDLGHYVIAYEEVLQAIQADMADGH